MTLDTTLAALTAAAVALADAEQAKAENELAKAEHECALVNSLIGAPNPLGQKGALHSATSAAAAASQDARIVEFRRERIALDRAVTLAKAALECAKIRSRAAVPG